MSRFVQLLRFALVVLTLPLWMGMLLVANPVMALGHNHSLLARASATAAIAQSTPADTVVRVASAYPHQTSATSSATSFGCNCPDCLEVALQQLQGQASLRQFLPNR
jgi:hypothetical protein